MPFRRMLLPGEEVRADCQDEPDVKFNETFI